MEVVLATHSLAAPGGTETYALTVAEHLQRLGHEATVLADVGGAMAEVAVARGVRVVLGAERPLPRTPDVFLVQDGALAFELADRWPAVPQVFRACSDIYDYVLPPQLPGLVAAVVVASDRVERRVRAMAADFEIVRLHQPVDTSRFAPAGELPEHPRRAVLLGNYLTGARHRLLVDTWGRAGVQCVAVGAQGEPHVDPVAAIAEADIVVGKARAVVEGMACGRAAYVYDFYGGDGWVTTDSYSALEGDNFAGQATDWTVSEERLAGDLAAYRPEMGLVNRDLAVHHHAARDHVAALVALFERVVAAPPEPVAPLRELARLVRTHSATEIEVQYLHVALDATVAGTRAAERRAEEAEARASAAEADAARLRALLATRRARAGFAAGRAADRMRRR